MIVLGAVEPSHVAESLGPWVAFVVNLGFVGWLAWHHTARAIPKLVADFRADIQMERQEFSKTLTDIKNAFEREQAADRQHCVEQLKLTNQQWREIWTAGFKHGKEQTAP